MNSLWSMSTTVREASRIYGFLKTAKKIEGEVWNKETQSKFQILLVQNREYLNDVTNVQTFHNLNQEQINWLIEKEKSMPYEIAKSIILNKNYVGGADLRGRESMAPLKKMGLVYLDENNKICISDIGNKFIKNEISYEEFFLDSLLKIQYPNPLDDSYKNWNIKPFIGILHLIKKVNILCRDRGIKAKGLSKDEFGIFGLSMQNYFDIDIYAKKVIDYRLNYEFLTSEEDKKKYKESYINEFLSEFNNPQKNCGEYADNMIRYFRQTKLIYIRGKYGNVYIDLEPRREVEIDEILMHDNAKPLTFIDDKEWINYFSTYGSYELPYETMDKLQIILKGINDENYELAEDVNLKYEAVTYVGNDKNYIKKIINESRYERTKLQNLKLKKDYFATIKIDETIQSLMYILQHNKEKKLKNKISLELEKWTNISLNILDDAILIKPNTIVGDDNEPINTAPGGVADIECYYDDFNFVCEVTTLISRDQWYNEGQPVMRHLRMFEERNFNKQNYCLFIAPKLHDDTINTFWNSVKYEYEGKTQKIVPITIYQLIELLDGVKKLHSQGGKMLSSQLKVLFDKCTNVTNVKSSKEWLPLIDEKIKELITTL